MNAIRLRLLCFTFFAAIPIIGCAGYAGSVKDLRASLQRGDKAGALQIANTVLEVKTSEEMPPSLNGDVGLLLLERGTVKQGLEQFSTAAADFRASDKSLELLDLKNDTMGNIGKYLFSDDSTAYRAPAYEKLLLNSLNMLNYLSLQHLEDARVETRRLRVMQEYLKGEESDQAALLNLGSFLAGFTFEMGGDAEQALGFYSDALATSDFPALKESIRDLAPCTSYRTEPIEALLKAQNGEATCRSRQKGAGTILVVSTTGLAPYKRAMRIPIGAAIFIAGSYLGAIETARAQQLAAKGLLAFVNFPILEPTPEQRNSVEVTVSGQDGLTGLALDVTQKVIKAWDSIKARLMVAAIVRMITRLVAGEATGKAVEKAGGGAIGGLLASLAVQGSLAAADTPDTRSWTTLPSKIFVTRVSVTPGTHDVAIQFSGPGGKETIHKKVEVGDGGYAVVFAASMR